MRRHLTYANVMSTFGVFLGLAGGYAAAKIGGDGSVRSGQITNLTENYKTLVTVPGLGKVTAACPGGTETKAAWNNTSGQKARVSVEREGTTFQFLQSTGESSAYELSLPDHKIVFQVAKDNGADAPQTVVSVAAYGFADPCATNVAAEAISTR